MIFIIVLAFIWEAVVYLNDDLFADLEDDEDVQPHHLSEAIHYRSLDRESWGA